MYDKTVRRRRAVLGLLLASSLILLTLYFGESAGGGLHSVQRGVLQVVSPIQEGASRALKPFRDLFGWVGDTLDAKGQVKALRTERDQLRADAIAGVAATRENQKLKRLMALEDSAGLSAANPVRARVIGQDPSLWFTQIEINKGTDDGLREGQPVVTGEGLIGRVSFVTSHSATVKLITDHTTYVPARINEGAGVDGGIEAETGRPDELLMLFTTRNDVVRPNQTVVTSGTRSRTDKYISFFPPNLPIGRVTRVDDAGTDDQRIHIQPFADMRRLEFVQVLTKTPNGNRPPS